MDYTREIWVRVHGRVSPSRALAGAAGKMLQGSSRAWSPTVKDHTGLIIIVKFPKLSIPPVKSIKHLFLMSKQRKINILMGFLLYFGQKRLFI